MTTASPGSSRLEVLIGRSLAAFIHPEAAWRVGRKGRIPLLLGYFFAGYVVIFVTLLSGLS